MKKITLALGLIFACASSLAMAAEKWDLPTPYGDGTHQTQVARSFAEEVNLNSGGKLTIKVHSGGALIKHPEIYRAVKSRQVQIGEVFFGRLGNNNPILSSITSPSSRPTSTVRKSSTRLPGPSSTNSRPKTS